ncbi:hypothetical protein EUGRSUZ_D00292 [Eucalyptus grandis]|uniref:Uncharacterized protein n=2 Tax=Eucalyptus grandis TaxID=71139 RepID=A0ACC3L2W9_EUCGR|nr:hypothetical protein EUGRSUZ_D00292 [Eucalyptus grandis]
MASIKFEVAPFDGQNNFGLWRIKMEALFHREGLLKALDGKYTDNIIMVEIKEMEERENSTIQLLLSNKVLRKVIDEETALRLWISLRAST